MPRKTLEVEVIDLIHAVGLLVRRVRAAAASHELSLTESAVMGRLAKDGPATTADLARAEGVKPQSMGTTIAALEEMGMVERKPHPTDGRQVNIDLTFKGVAVRKDTRDAKRTWLAQAIAQLDDKDRETLFEAGEIIRRLVQMAHAWRALRHRNFKLFFFGQSISVIGTWMTRLATSWLVYRLTHSVLLLGIVSFAGQIVSFALGPFAGVWVERLNRRKLLVWTQAAAAVQSLALAALTLAHVITLWEIIALTALQGLINAFDMPGRQSFLVQMVDDPNDLSNAIAINSSMANGARLIGPAIAGLVIGAVGEGWCFLIDGVSYFAVIASLLLMRIKPTDIRRSATAACSNRCAKVGTTSAHFVPSAPSSACFALLSLMGWPYAVLCPSSPVRCCTAARILSAGSREPRESAR
jgi:DNA-binding MarR family transcriptional regulator